MAWPEDLSAEDYMVKLVCRLTSMESAIGDLTFVLSRLTTQLEIANSIDMPDETANLEP